MTQRNFAWLACVLATWLAASAAAARPVLIMNHESCIFDEFVPLAAVPYYMTDRDEVGEVSRLVGASLYVVAKSGQSAERLALQLDRDLSAPERSARDGVCGPTVSGVRAVVVATGAGFWIVYVAGTERAAAALVDWTQWIVTAFRPTTYGKKDAPSPRRRATRPPRRAP